MRVGIIGAGAAGMSAAWDLVNAGHEVVLFEAGSEVGGLAAGFKDAGWDWSLEKFYHHWFESDSEIKTLLEEMGVWDQVIFPRPKTSYWINNKSYRSEMDLSALFLPISLIATARMGFAGLYLKKAVTNGQWLEKYTAHDWMRRYMGEEAYNKFFRPLLIGKFSTDYTKVNMAWMWARIYTRTLRLGIFKGGFQAFLEAMHHAIEQKGAAVHLNAPVQRLHIENGQPVLTVTRSGQAETHTFDRVISTTSPKLLLTMTEGLAETPYGQQVAKLKSIGALCVVLALRQSLLTDGTYWLNLPADNPDKSKSQFPFLALVEHTNWMPKEHYGGDVLIYCGDYVPPEHEYFQMSEEALVERFTKILPTFNPDFKPEWVRKAWVFRAPYAQPVPEVNHSQNIPPLKTPLPGVFWASMSQVYPYDRGTNFAVEIGRRVARMAMQ
ncbi:MAG: NAD(P)/FAD-dependent oxidoreductase [Anaerolineae bacterium]